MDSKLSKLSEGGCLPRQILIPEIVESRLTAYCQAKECLMSMRSFVHATQKASAKLLMTPVRDESNSSHDFRRAHEEVGCYLTNDYLGKVLDSWASITTLSTL